MCRFLSLILVLSFSHAAFCADWKQFRGPNGSGVSGEKGLPISWSADKNIAWKADLPGRGLSNPVIAAGRVYVTCSSGWKQDRLHVLCFDEQSGKKLWHRQYWATGHTQSHTKTCMAAPSPVTDGKRVYALFGSHDLAALDKDGNLLWFRSLANDYPTVGNNVGMASSPVLYRNTLLLALENAGDSFALAIDKTTGKNKWRVNRPRGINWVTPLVFSEAGKAQVVFQSPANIAAYDPATGNEIWKLAGQEYSKIPSPVFADGLILTQAKKFLAIRPGSSGVQAEIGWNNRKLRCGYSSPLVYQGRVFALSSQGVLKVADAVSGASLWDMRVAGPVAASPVAGDGKIYVANEEGATTVIAAAGKANVLGVNRLGVKILATPAIANGAIYLRSDEGLYCIRGER